MKYLTKKYPASTLKRGDTVVFLGTSYTVKSVWSSGAHMAVIFVGTNDGQPYYYEPDEMLEVQR